MDEWRGSLIWSAQEVQEELESGGPGREQCVESLEEGGDDDAGGWVETEKVSKEKAVADEDRKSVV